MVLNATSYMLCSFVPGSTVDKIWPKLSNEQKVVSFSNPLNSELLKLRQLSVPDRVSLGGVCGEGRKDTRRHMRISRERISNRAGFEDFLFSNPHYRSAEYIALLRSLSSSHTGTIVFSYGDLRAANLVVQPDQHGKYLITGILGWEASGFYPDYFEFLKAN